MKQKTKTDRVYDSTAWQVKQIQTLLGPTQRPTKPDIYAKSVQRELYWLKQWKEMNPVQAAKILCENLLHGNANQEHALKELLRLLTEMEAIEQHLNFEE